MGNRSKQRRIKKKAENKMNLLKKCENAGTCKYVSTCPTCDNRICDSNAKCCVKCAWMEMCPMKGIK